MIIDHFPLFSLTTFSKVRWVGGFSCFQINNTSLCASNNTDQCVQIGSRGTSFTPNSARTEFRVSLEQFHFYSIALLRVFFDLGIC